jgi:hypothetical protein
MELKRLCIIHEICSRSSHSPKVSHARCTASWPQCLLATGAGFLRQKVIPSPSEAFTTVSVKHSDVPVWFHVYSTKKHPTHADSFSKGWGDTRFAPIRADDGSWLHTYYVASTPECAYIESVLHEIPLNPPGSFDEDELRFYHLAQVILPEPLECVSFHTPYLPALQNLTRAQLIDSLPACYQQF